MRTLLAVASFLLLITTSLPTWAQGQEAGFRPLFNGKDLDGWIRVNTAESTWTVSDGMLICSGKPVGELRTTQMYQNFILELEWRHMKPRGNAGVFVWADDITARGVPFHRSIEVQVLENDYGNARGHTTHGDIFPIHGATMTPINGRGGSRAFPTEFRSKPSPEWNHYRIECRDGEISLAVNGKVVTRGKDCSPRKGYICLESEGGVVHYRNVQIQQLPDTPVDPQHVAIANRNFRCLYNGMDLSGWKATNDNWRSRDWLLSYAADEDGSVTTTESFGDVGFVFDVRSGNGGQTAAANIRGAEIPIDPTNAVLAKHFVGGRQWNRFEGELRGNRLTLKLNGEVVFADKEIDASNSGPLRLDATAPVDFANVYVRELQ